MDLHDLLNLFHRQKAVLGLNERNLRYIRPYNKTDAKRIADDKIRTKKILRHNGIKTAKVYSQIKTFTQLENFDWTHLPDSFALKPRRGFGGEGIIVVYAKSKKTGNWIKADKSQLSIEYLKSHISNILDGTYSLGNTPDSCLFEERIKMHPFVKKFAFRGIPDVRVIVFNKVPVMAELRLPTKASDGKANLHQGGIIVGIDIANGRTTTAVQYNKIIDRHPDNGEILSGIKIPYWDKVLELSVKSQIYTNIGFLGADIVIDRDHGPMVMELNARPGLGIQIANQDGLKARLVRVEGIKIKSVERGIRVAKNLFGGEIEEEIEEISGKHVIGILEKVKFTKRDGEVITLIAKCDTGAYLSSIDTKVALQLGLKEAIDYFDKLEFKKKNLSLDEARLIQKEWSDKVTIHEFIEGLGSVRSGNGVSLRPIVKVEFELNDVKIETNLNIENRGELNNSIIIGRKDLKNFLIDPTKNPPGTIF